MENTWKQQTLSSRLSTSWALVVSVSNDTWPIGAHHICISCVYRQLCIVFCCLLMLFQVCKYSCIHTFIHIYIYILYIYIYIFVHNATRSNTVYLRDVNNSTHAIPCLHTIPPTKATTRPSDTVGTSRYISPKAGRSTQAPVPAHDTLW